MSPLRGPAGGRRRCASGALQVGGFAGWWIWLFIHIAFLTRYRAGGSGSTGAHVG